MKMHPVGDQVVPCGQTDITKLTNDLRNFANASKNWKMVFD